MHLSTSKSGRPGASPRFCSLTSGRTSACGLVCNVGTIERRHARLLAPLFSDICDTCGSDQSARWDGWLKHFQTPHAPHFCWPLTKTSNQDFHDACRRSRPAPLLVDITYAGTRTQRLLLIILPLRWGYLYTAVQANVGFSPSLKPKCKYTRFEGGNGIIQMHFFSFVGRQSGILQCLIEHSGCKHTFCLDFNGSQILNDNRWTDKHPKKCDAGVGIWAALEVSARTTVVI